MGIKTVAVYSDADTQAVSLNKEVFLLCLTEGEGGIVIMHGYI